MVRSARGTWTTRSIGMPLPFNDTEDNRSSLGVRHRGIGFPEATGESALGRLELPILGFSELEGGEEGIHIEFVHTASLTGGLSPNRNQACFEYREVHFLEELAVSHASPGILRSPHHVRLSNGVNPHNQASIALLTIISSLFLLPSMIETVSIASGRLPPFATPKVS